MHGASLQITNLVLSSLDLPHSLDDARKMTGCIPDQHGFLKFINYFCRGLPIASMVDLHVRAPSRRGRDRVESFAHWVRTAIEESFSQSQQWMAIAVFVAPVCW